MRKLKKKEREKGFAFMPLLFVAAVCAVLVAVSVGQVNIPLGQTGMILLKKLLGVELSGLSDIPSSYFNIVWMIRFPRTLTSCWWAWVCLYAE